MTSGKGSICLGFQQTVPVYVFIKSLPTENQDFYHEGTFLQKLLKRYGERTNWKFYIAKERFQTSYQSSLQRDVL